MAASMLSTATVATINRAAPPSQAVAPYTGLRPNSPMVSRKSKLASFAASNGGRVSNSDMLVWPPEGRLKFETLSYLRPLSRPELGKEIDYLIRMGWIPCLEFDKVGFVRRENNRSPGYYDGRYWTMWKLPMFGCFDSSQVLRELDEVIAAYPNYFVRIIGFDNKRQVQCISFIAYKPPGY